MRHLKQFGLVLCILGCFIWILSLQQTESIEVTPVQNVRFVVEEQGLLPSRSPSPLPPSPSKSPSPKSVFFRNTNKSPSKSPSITPTPFAIFIQNSLYGNPITRTTNITYFDTTINTPLNITLKQLVGDAWERISYVSISKPAGNGTASISSANTIKYVPSSWYKGRDSFTYKLEYEDDNGKKQTIEQQAHIRVRVGVMLNKALLAIPTGYVFAETKSSQTAAIKAMLGNAGFQQLVPQHDTWLNRRYNTCAIVGNGGCLFGKKRGAEIDSHDVVVRINVSPLTNYTEDVGSRIDISFANGPHSYNCWKRNQTDLSHNTTYEIMAHLSFVQQFKNFTYCVNNFQFLHYNPMSYLFVDTVDSILNKYVMERFNGTTKKYRSTGMMAATAMAMICDHVSIYGFERGPNMMNFYWNTTKDQREWSGHNYEAEKEYYKDLVRGTGLFEPFLELYDLYKSFSYIVD